MSSLRQTASLRSLALVALSLSAPSALAQANDLGLEAIVAPQINKSFGTESRTRIGLDFYRVSAGGSLLAQYGTGADYTDYMVMFRLAGFKQFFGEPLSRGFIYGLGIGATYSSGMPKEVTDTPEKVSFADIKLNPYVRYLFDINGWIGPYIEVGYELTPYRKGWGESVADPAASTMMLGFGFAFEAER